MRKMYIILLAMCFCTHTDAQEKRHNDRTTLKMADSAQAIQPDASPLAHPLAAPPQPHAVAGEYRPSIHEAASDTLHLPLLDARGRVLPINMYPYRWCGWNNWELHRGLNLNLGASVFAFLGKDAPGSAGFTQSISAMYAMPLTKNLSLAVGGYLNSLTWSHSSHRDAGLSAVLGYRINERWEAYVYGQKSIVRTHHIPYPLYDMGALGDRIGAAVKYNFNPSFSVQLSVERGWMPKQDSRYFDQYNYPIPGL